MDWHYAFVKNRKLVGVVSWEEYSAAMVMRFGSGELERPIAQLKLLREENSFHEYGDNFVSLISKVDLSDEDQVAMFMAGLRKDNQKFLMVLNPRNLQQAIAFAKALASEESPYKSAAKRQELLNASTKQSGWQGPRQFPPISTFKGAGNGQTGGKPIMQNRAQGPVAGRTTAYQPPHKRLLPSEIEEKRAK